MSVLRQRGDHYLALGKRPQFRKFLKGWLNRNESLRKVLT
jgi:hypothetical protein